MRTSLTVVWVAIFTWRTSDSGRLLDHVIVCGKTAQCKSLKYEILLIYIYRLYSISDLQPIIVAVIIRRKIVYFNLGTSVTTLYLSYRKKFEVIIDKVIWTLINHFISKSWKLLCPTITVCFSLHSEEGNGTDHRRMRTVTITRQSEGWPNLSQDLESDNGPKSCV